MPYKDKSRAAQQRKEFYERNRKEISKKRKEDRIKFPFREKGWHLKTIYKISMDEYNKILEKQNGLCAICSRPETSIVRGKIPLLSVDHDHNTGKIRGLLCAFCNHGIGRFRDDIDLMKKAIKYLELSQKGQIL